MAIRTPKGANFNSVLIAFVPVILIVAQFFFNSDAKERNQDERKGQGKMSAKVEILTQKQDATNSLLIAFYAEFKAYAMMQKDKMKRLETKVTYLNKQLTTKIKTDEKNQNSINGVQLRIDKLNYFTASSCKRAD